MKSIIRFLIPGGLLLFVSKNRLMHLFFKYPLEKSYLKKNSVLKEVAKGEEFYLICNGPSVSKQPLMNLKAKNVVTVSSGYLHADIKEIKPRYHFVPALTFTSKFTYEKAVIWLKEMDNHLPETTALLMSITEKDLVERAGLFANREVFYLSMSLPWEENLNFDITKRTYEVQSVPIMALITLIYMGVKTINILGAEHDSFTGNYKYAFEYEDPSLQVEKGIVVSPQSDSFYANYILFKQYEAIASLAKKKNIDVFNLTIGGVLDVFPRRSF